MTYPLHTFDTETFNVQTSVGGAVVLQIPEWYSTAISASSTSVVARLTRIFTQAASVVSRVHDEVYLAGFIASASGASLDALAAGWNLQRQTRESDAGFRARIPIEVTLSESSGTVQEVKDIVAYVLQMDSSAVSVVERYMPYPCACFTVRLTAHPCALIDWSVVDAVVAAVRAAGTYYESPGYTITPEWVDGAAGYGYNWGSSWGS